jgi:hypothetical protein
MRQARYELDRQTIREMAANGASAIEIAQTLQRSIQGVRNLAAMMGISFRESKSVGIGGTCNHDCPGGRACMLRRDVPHTLHCCRVVGCECHSAERYAEAKRERMER